MTETEEEWSDRHDKITAEQKEEGAHEHMAAGWKQWLAARDQTAPCAGTAAGEEGRRGWRLGELILPFLDY